VIISVAITAAVDAALRRHLLREDGQEDLCFALWRPSTGERRRSHLVVDPIFPGNGERNVHGNASFEPQYFLRALQHAANAGAGLVMLHSHPLGRGWQDMSSDDIAAERGHAAQSFAFTDLPLLGMTLAGDGSWTARVWPRQRRGSYIRTPATSVRVVGDRLGVTYDPELLPAPSVNASFVRTVSSWGDSVQATIGRLRVGIVGAGSVGALVAEALMRTGIRDLVLVDFDVVKPHNLDRLAHATRLDAILRRPKVFTLREALLRLAPHDLRIDARQLSVVESEGLKTVLDCDVIFSCVDRPWPRQLLDHVAFAHLIPVIDGGIRVRRKSQRLTQADWKAHTVAPGRRCMECIGQYSAADVALERAGDLDDPKYIEGLPEGHYLKASENVFAYSQACASLEILQFLSMVVAPLEIANPGEWNFHFVTGTLDVQRAATCAATCVHESVIASGDAASGPSGRHPVAEQARHDGSHVSIGVRTGRLLRHRAHEIAKHARRTAETVFRD
jgi:molybdopterin-synthase adenylyltransferase